MQISYRFVQNKSAEKFDKLDFALATTDFVFNKFKQRATSGFAETKYRSCGFR